VTPLGGCGEFGRNLTCYSTDDDLVAVDCGAQLPDIETPGVDLFLPDFGWILERRGPTASVDHHARARRPSARAPLRARLVPCAGLRAPGHAPTGPRPLPSRAGKGRSSATPRGTADPPSVRSRWRRSRPPTPSLTLAALAITGGGRRVVHTGDLKLDADARIATDLERLGALGRSGIDLLVSDSTNASRPGRAGTEAQRAPRAHGGDRIGRGARLR